MNGKKRLVFLAVAYSAVALFSAGCFGCGGKTNGAISYNAGGGNSHSQEDYDEDDFDISYEDDDDEYDSENQTGMFSEDEYRKFYGVWDYDGLDFVRLCSVHKDVWIKIKEYGTWDAVLIDGESIASGKFTLKNADTIVLTDQKTNVSLTYTYKNGYLYDDDSSELTEVGEVPSGRGDEIHIDDDDDDNFEANDYNFTDDFVGLYLGPADINLEILEDYFYLSDPTGITLVWGPISVEGDRITLYYDDNTVYAVLSMDPSGILVDTSDGGMYFRQ